MTSKIEKIKVILAILDLPYPENEDTALYTALSDLYEAGYEIGRAEGYDSGYDMGYEVWYRSDD